MTYESGNSDWPFTSRQCIENLELARSDNPSLSYNLEWIALSVETFAVEHSKGIVLSENSVLLSEISSSLDSVTNRELMDLIISSPLNCETICDVLRATLCLPYYIRNLERANRLYTILPKQPTQRIFDVYVMYQITFGLTNQLDSWNNHFSDVRSKYSWNELNRLQLDYGLALISKIEKTISQFRTELINSFEAHTEDEFPTGSNTKVKTARSSLNWLLLYSSISLDA
jgi:hypothetical protein